MTLKKRLGSSTAWMSVAASGSSVVSFFIFIILSRILAPEDIGLVAFALIVVEVGKILVNAGFAQAVVQHHQWDNVYASTCFYLNITFAILVTLLVIFIGAPLVGIYYEAQAGPILQVLSAIFFIEGLKSVHEGKLKREFAFKVIAFRTIVSSLVSGIVGVYLALNDYGVWALVWQQLVNQFLLTFITLVSAKWMPSLTFSISQMKQLLTFSSPLMLAQLISNIGSNIFELFIGIMIGPAALGFYRVGGRALYILQDIVLKPFEHTSLSALSRLTDLSQQAQGAIRMNRMSAYLTFPIFFGAAAVAPEFIIFAFGEKWAPSGNIMTILAIGVAPLAIGYHINAALTASGNSRLVMVIATLAFILSCILGAIAIPLGLTATAIAFLVRNYLIIMFDIYLFKRIFGVGMFSMLKNIMPVLMASIGMFLIIMGAKLFLHDRLPAALNILVLCAIGAFSYLLLMATIFRTETKNFFTESADLAPQKLKPFILAIQGFIKLT